MKKFIPFILVTIFFLSSSLTAQLQIGYVDSDAIMKKLPDAQDAQKRIDTQIDEWQKELQEMQQEWKSQFDDYERRERIGCP